MISVTYILCVTTLSYITLRLYIKKVDNNACKLYIELASIDRSHINMLPTERKKQTKKFMKQKLPSAKYYILLTPPLVRLNCLLIYI